ncbi:hypothetical protein A2631_01575 [Candidatus Daviesbacteria bacterium RIFCSPHIGHO2_01_FULL_44_29]|uniref:SAM-dependent MTase RsmB/NOP-type domain-containing protein n=1 Tax=Candidatus Daviesbacteria bacterium RIFCSPHIGHO2_02_FULL_43_12 TaxID=1797776 RepID=A0A1F5KJX1_9BACT|nr:MAG: hypothetical protein A2631_01575 [Candidatus Daviesbacteria bacterium RIFCSPHIGHO2_01_FULL_44_29]OGE39060.1 MAG: hypothetical protein A3E86_00505 [Candidatus Daviesbacteria bacterium RIFCSPHIGHO2_12_FULL_47_45]OGE41095.1 MAG: hypothetical protein A3D25_00970 [Candidatus Daviesbacteria bacterium RIFCSPHIGHO2_02_FULL_43_12]OGE69294.1 MAG: hypothetical protein A3B55_02710 [Candidatus Daviesbacteria bacterium RIFCSPLOWO2_01_FULL_43_15]
MADQSWQKLPQKFLNKLKLIIPPQNIESVLQSFTTIRPTTFRANTLKISASDLKIKLKEAGLPFEKVGWRSGAPSSELLPEAFILQDTPQRVLTENDIYNQGLVYVQSLSSMIPPLVLDPQPGELILDLTAAPGSKTTQIAALMKNTGQIIANDKSRVRLFKLEANLKLQGVTNSQITYLDGKDLWRKYPEYFDKTLVDVPCSMEGRFLSTYEKSYRDWTEKKVRELSALQKFLIRAGVTATKVGGLVVYSTCTISPEENESVIDWLLEKEQGKVEVEEISLGIPESYPALVSWQGKTYHPQVKLTLRILPTALTEGFFVAKLRKVASNKPTKSVL